MCKQSTQLTFVIIWCSVYHGELADQLIRKPEELRAKELCNSSINCTSKASTVSSANRINNLIWLKIPIPRTTASQAVEKTEATHSSNKKRTSLSSPSASSHPSTQSQTPNYATNTINLLSIIYHIFLPISYEFGPDLVYLLIGSNEDDYNFITPDTSARLLYLLNGLGAAVIVNGTSQQLCSDSLVGSLLGKPLPTGFDETQSTSPSSGVKQAIHLVMEQNHQRWKFLKFCVWENGLCHENMKWGRMKRLPDCCFIADYQKNQYYCPKTSTHFKMMSIFTKV
uniref:Uncharacterized protein n=1 Tax=Trichobilharzia regenti TaxID=157069 RepID=A0AA85KAJ9_TRIRE|nr:unnamed protein product [Trichobilharzia regenti]